MLGFLYSLVHLEIAFVEEKKSCQAQAVEIADQVIYKYIEENPSLIV